MRAEKSEEVDFVLIDDVQGKKMIQVSYNLDFASTREREIRALALMGKKLGLNEGDIITFDMEGAGRSHLGPPFICSGNFKRPILRLFCTVTGHNPLSTG